MRVTDQSLFDAAGAAIGKARERHARATAEVTTGNRLQHPGDDPGAAGLAAGHSLEAARFQAISDGVGRASDELDAADAAMGAVGSVFSRARELAVQMSNSSYSAADRAAAAAEVSILFRQAVAALNTQHGGRFLLGGAKDGSPPFDAAGNYSGDTAVRQVEIAPGVYESASLRADVAVKGAGGGVDAMAALTSLATALAGNDVPGVQATLDELDAAIGQVAQVRARGGAAMNVLDAARNASLAGRDGARSAVAALADADPFESATRLGLAERALESALTASARSFQPTLLDVLK